MGCDQDPEGWLELEWEGIWMKSFSGERIWQQSSTTLALGASLSLLLWPKHNPKISCSKVGLWRKAHFCRWTCHPQHITKCHLNQKNKMGVEWLFSDENPRAYLVFTYNRWQERINKNPKANYSHKGRENENQWEMQRMGDKFTLDMSMWFWTHQCDWTQWSFWRSSFIIWDQWDNKHPTLVEPHGDPTLCIDQNKSNKRKDNQHGNAEEWGLLREWLPSAFVPETSSWDRNKQRSSILVYSEMSVMITRSGDTVLPQICLFQAKHQTGLIFSGSTADMVV